PTPFLVMLPDGFSFWPARIPRTRYQYQCGCSLFPMKYFTPWDERHNRIAVSSGNCELMLPDRFLFEPAKSLLRRTRIIYWWTEEAETGIWTVSLDRSQLVA